jgi:hypothetical protein
MLQGRQPGEQRADPCIPCQLAGVANLVWGQPVREMRTV